MPEEKLIAYVTVGGSLMILLILIFFSAFLLMYQRRNARYRLSLLQLELDKQLALTNAVIETEEKERAYFARELHDSVGQMLAAIKMNVSSMKSAIDHHPELGSRLELLQQITMQSIQEVRSISHKLLPGALADFGLINSLDHMVKPLEPTGVKVTLNADADVRLLPKMYELALYRICQELISNTIKHAEATAIQLYLYQENNEVIFRYQDNGKGFDPTKKSIESGIGMRNMESRINLMKAVSVWESRPGEGVSLTIKIPTTN